jgi:hypothetical protein
VSKPFVPKNLKPAVWVVAIVIVAVAALAGASHLRANNGKAAAPRSAPASTAQQRAVRATMDALPLAFEPNQGQTDSKVKYLARGSGYTVFLTSSDAVFALHSSAHSAATRFAGKNLRPTPSTPDTVKTAAIDLKMVGANQQPQIAAGAELPGRTNYFIGNDASKWQRGIKQFATVSYKDVYPGVDMKFHGQQKQVEFDFLVAPGANAEPIRFNVSGATHVAANATGDLVLSSAAGNVLLHKPVAYQEKGDTREPVEARFALQANNTVSFELGNYDHSRELVIDPTVAYPACEYATYLGGSAEDDAYGIAVDSSGNAYVTGQTASTNFPGASGSNAGGFDVFVTEIAAGGATLVYSTYVGGSGNDSGNAIAVDTSGDAFVAGGTASTDFPTSGTPFQSSNGGGSLDAFVFELNPTGTGLTYSTYLGGSGTDVANGIAVDSTGNTYVVGSTSSSGSSGFPTKDPIIGSLPGSSNAFVTKLNPSGSALVYSTYLGGSSIDYAAAVALDSSENAYVTGGTGSTTFPTTTGAFQTTCGSCSGGQDNAFVTVINAAGSGYVYSTFLGGSVDDEGLAIAADSSGEAYVAGFATSSNFPVKNALQSKLATGATQNAFVSKLNSTGSGLVFSTYLGGNATDGANGIALDGSGYAYVTGMTSSTNFPMASATQGTIGGENDAFVSEVSPTGSLLVFSTYLGGSGNENTNTSGNGFPVGAIAVNSIGSDIYIAGNTASTDFPFVNAYQSLYGGSTDAFVAAYAQSNYTVAATTPASVTSGNPSSSAVTLTSLYGYSSPVNLTCSVAAVSGTGAGAPLPTCGFTNASPTWASGVATTTLNISTTASGSAVRRKSRFPAMWMPVIGLALLGMPFASAKVGHKKFLGILMLCLTVSAFVVMPSCSSSSSGGGGQTCAAAPSVPAGLAAASTTATGTSLSWTASTVGTDCSVTNYTIYQNGTEIGTSTTPSFNVTGLSASTQYSFTVSATDSAGASAQSSALQVTTLSTTSPAGSYTITITGTGTDANTMTHSAQVTLVVTGS